MHTFISIILKQDYSVIQYLVSITSKSFRAFSNVLLSFPRRWDSILPYYRITPWSWIWALLQLNPFALLATCFCHSRAGGNPLLHYFRITLWSWIWALLQVNPFALSAKCFCHSRAGGNPYYITTGLLSDPVLGSITSKSFRALSNVLLSFPRRRESINTFCRITPWSCIGLYHK